MRALISKIICIVALSVGVSYAQAQSCSDQGGSGTYGTTCNDAGHVGYWNCFQCVINGGGGGGNNYCQQHGGSGNYGSSCWGYDNYGNYTTGTWNCFQCMINGGGGGYNSCQQHGGSGVYGSSCSGYDNYGHYGSGTWNCFQCVINGGGGGYGGGGNISASRNYCNSDLCDYNVYWNVNGGSSVLTVQIPSEGPEKLMACSGSSGNSDAPWIAPGKTYVFRVYASSQCTVDVSRYTSPAAVTNVYGGQ